MNQGVVTSANTKVESGKLKEWDYVCSDPLRQEAHNALEQEFEAAIEFARSDKLTLEEGRYTKCLGKRYPSFNAMWSSNGQHTSKGYSDLIAIRLLN